MFSNSEICHAIQRHGWDPSSHTAQHPRHNLLIVVPASVGQYAVQLASIFNFNVITTCSQRNFDLVKGFGANHVFDYSAKDVIEQIHAAAPDIKYVFDTIGDHGSSALASKSSNSNCKICTVRPGKANCEGVPSSVIIKDVIVWTAFYKEIKYKEFVYPVSHISSWIMRQVLTMF